MHIATMHIQSLILDKFAIFNESGSFLTNSSAKKIEFLHYLVAFFNKKISRKFCILKRSWELANWLRNDIFPNVLCIFKLDNITRQKLDTDANLGQSSITGLNWFLTRVSKETTGFHGILF